MGTVEPHLRAAQAGDETSFRALLDPHSDALRRHCYRMLGSFSDAEDAHQETLLKAWQALPRFLGGSSLRTWLFRIATNTCVNMIDRNPKRVLRVEGSPPANPAATPEARQRESLWIGPLPDDLPADEAGRPERRYEEKESLELAFVAALQHLTPSQRSTLILREVLGFSGAEVAEILGMSPGAVYSIVQRAHRAIDDKLPAISQQQVARSLGDDRLQSIVDGYIAAWQDADLDALVAMLAQDAVMTMPPRPTWFAGREAIATFLAAEPMAPGRHWILTPTRCNGQLAFQCRRIDAGTDSRLLHATHVLTLGTDGLVREIASFLAPEGRRNPPDLGS